MCRKAVWPYRNIPMFRKNFLYSSSGRKYTHRVTVLMRSQYFCFIYRFLNVSSRRSSINGIKQEGLWTESSKPGQWLSYEKKQRKNFFVHDLEKQDIVEAVSTLSEKNQYSLRILKNHWKTSPSSLVSCTFQETRSIVDPSCFQSFESSIRSYLSA